MNDMTNFIYSVPTKIYFGKGQISHLGEAVAQYGHRALLVYGGGSIKKMGLYDTAIDLLKKNSVAVTELSGVEPNPKIESVRAGVKLCRENQIDVVLAVGGGSSIDCAKVIAAGACYDGDAWDLVIHPEKIQNVLPIVTVLTLSATGSEMDAFAVISDMEKNDKFGTAGEGLKPKASILDPEYTYSVPKGQTAAGTADIMSHIFENYFTNVKGAFIQARFSESLLKTCIQYGKIAIDDPTNYEARANLMWASSLAINGILPSGAAVAWSVHPMEHELSAFYDITHGVGLAILTPNWMKHVLNEQTVGQFVQYGVNVWGIDPTLPPFEIANKAIQNTRDYFNQLSIPSTLREVGIGEEKLEIMAKKAASMGINQGFVPLTADDVLAIYKASL
jgi:alcohol dehydrogenase YqhD (iron-dependent ADH family)